MAIEASPFTRSTSDPHVTRIGEGCAGGKVLGLATIEQEILPELHAKAPVTISIDGKNRRGVIRC